MYLQKTKKWMPRAWAAALALALLFGGMVLPIAAAGLLEGETTSLVGAGTSSEAAEGGVYDYSDLYVQEGLTLFLDGFDPTGADLEEGLWFDKTGGAPATLLTPGFWRREAGGGLRFDLCGYASWETTLGNTGVEIGASRLPEGDFTVEFLYTPRGLTDEKGESLPHKQDWNGSAYGLFNGNRAAFSFGGLHFLQFMASEAPLATNALQIRAMYCEDGNYYRLGYANTLGDHILYKELGAPEMYTLLYKETPMAQGDAYIGAEYTFLREENTVYSLSNRETSKVGGQRYIDPQSGRFLLAGDMPGTLYAVRVYDRVLSKEERRQNYFADFCQMAGVDPRGIAALSREDKALLVTYAAFHPMSEAKAVQGELQEMIDFLASGTLPEGLLRYEGLQASLKEPGVCRGLFSMNALWLFLLEHRGGFSLELLGGPAALLSQRYEAEWCSLYQSGGARGGFLAGAAWDQAAPDCRELLALTDEAAYREMLRTLYDTGAFFGRRYYAALRAETASQPTLALGFAARLTLPGGRCAFSSSLTEGTVHTPLALAEYLVNRYDGPAFKAEAYGQNPLFLSLLEENGIAAAPYRPGRGFAAQKTWTVSSEEDPSGDYPSLKEALLAADAALQREPGLFLSLYLLDGTHRTYETLTLSGEGFAQGTGLGIFGSPRAVLTSEMPLSLVWQPVAETGYYVAEVSGAALAPFRHLYAEGKLLSLCYGGVRRAAQGGQEKTGQAVKTPSGAYKIYLDPHRIPEEDFPGTELHLSTNWEFRILPIARADFADRDAQGRVAAYLPDTQEVSDFMAKLDHGERYYWLENSLALLDEGGEYYYDSEAGLLYYYPLPEERLEEVRFGAPTLETILSFQSVQGLRLGGFTVTGTDHRYLLTHGLYSGGQAGHIDMEIKTPGAIEGQDLSQFEAYGLSFRMLAAHGLRLWGAQENIAIEGCRFEGIGGSAIAIGSKQPVATADSHLVGCRIRENVILDAARLLRSCCAVYLCQGREVEILQNTIDGCSYSGISVGWRWQSSTVTPGRETLSYRVLIAGNEVKHFMTDTCDGGAIYTLGGNADPEGFAGVYFNWIFGNHIETNATTGQGLGFYMPLYHDNASSNWETAENVFSLTPGNFGYGAVYLQRGNGTLSSPQARNILLWGNHFLRADPTLPETVGGQTHACKTEAEYFEKVIFYGHALLEYGLVQRDNFCTGAEQTPEASRITKLAGAMLSKQ